MCLYNYTSFSRRLSNKYSALALTVHLVDENSIYIFFFFSRIRIVLQIITWSQKIPHYPGLSVLVGMLLFLWLVQYCGLLVFLNMKLGCDGSCLRLLGCRLLFWLSGIWHPVQGLPQLLVSMHLRLTGSTCTGGLRGAILGKLCDAAWFSGFKTLPGVHLWEVIYTLYTIRLSYGNYIERAFLQHSSFPC